jgi:hypothetical protein
VNTQKITLATLPQASEQEIFDQVVRHLFAQGKRALNILAGGITQCAYRSADGCKCAAGCLIDDSEYRPIMEGGNWHSVIDAGLAPEDNSSLIRELQTVHDGYEPFQWFQRLHEAAEKFGLSSEILHQVTA